MGFHGIMLLLPLAGGVLAGVLLIQVDKIVGNMRNPLPVLQPGTDQELFAMPRRYNWLALWLGLAALAVAGGMLFLAVGTFEKAPQLTLPRALGLGLLGLALSCLPGYLSYKIFKMGSFRARADRRGLLVYWSGHYRFMAWSEFRTVAVRARGRQLVLAGGAEGPVHLEIRVAGFQRLLALVLLHLPPAKAPGPPLQFGRPDFKRRILFRRGILAAGVLGAGLALEAKHPWPLVWLAAAAALFFGGGQGPGSARWIRHVLVDATAVTLGTRSKTLVLKLDELEGAAIEDHGFKTGVRLGTHLRTKDGRSFRVDASVADPFVLAPALQETLLQPPLF